MIMLQKSKKEEAIQKRKMKWVAEKLVNQWNKIYINWLASEELNKNDDDEFDETKKYLKKSNLLMITEDRLRKLILYDITHLWFEASLKKWWWHH